MGKRTLARLAGIRRSRYHHRIRRVREENDFSRQVSGRSECPGGSLQHHCRWRWHHPDGRNACNLSGFGLGSGQPCPGGGPMLQARSGSAGHGGILPCGRNLRRLHSDIARAKDGNDRRCGSRRNSRPVYPHRNTRRLETACPCSYGRSEGGKDDGRRRCTA